MDQTSAEAAMASVPMWETSEAATATPQVACQVLPIQEKPVTASAVAVSAVAQAAMASAKMQAPSAVAMAMQKAEPRTRCKASHAHPASPHHRG